MSEPSPRVCIRDTEVIGGFAPMYDGVFTHHVKIVVGGVVLQSTSARDDGEYVDDQRLFTYGVRHWNCPIN